MFEVYDNEVDMVMAVFNDKKNAEQWRIEYIKDMELSKKDSELIIIKSNNE